MPCFVFSMNNDDLTTYPATAPRDRTGTPLCTCRLTEFGDIETTNPNCEGTDMH